MKKLNLLIITLGLLTGNGFYAKAQCGAPTNLTATYSNNVTTFSWDAVSGAVNYNLELRLHDGMPWDYAEYAQSVNGNSFSLTGIMHSARLDWRVQTVCSTDSSAFTASTFTLPCPEASGLNVTGITFSGATLNWTPAAGYNTLISDFVLAYRVYNSNSNWISLGHTSNSSKTVSGLSPNTTYEFCVNQTCPYANSSPAFGTFTTTSSPCSTPTNLTSTAGNTSVTLDWNAVSGAISYDIFFKTASATSWTTFSSTSNQLMIYNLGMNTAYEFKVRTICSVGPSAFSTVATFTTENCISNGNNSAEWIKYFKVGSIARSSGAESGGYYSSNSTTNLAIGSTNNNAQIQAGFSSTFRKQYFNIYIDFNRNGIYENNEKVYGSASITSTSKKSFKFSVPSTATSGITGMRVIMAREGTTINGCLTGFNGETEDYLVNLTSGSQHFISQGSDRSNFNSSEILIYPNPANSSINVQFPVKADKSCIYIADIYGKIVAQMNTELETTTYPFDISALNNGIYILSISNQEGILYSQKIIKY